MGLVEFSMGLEGAWGFKPISTSTDLGHTFLFLLVFHLLSVCLFACLSLPIIILFPSQIHSLLLNHMLGTITSVPTVTIISIATTQTTLLKHVGLCLVVKTFQLY